MSVSRNMSQLISEGRQWLQQQKGRGLHLELEASCMFISGVK